MIRVSQKRGFDLPLAGAPEADLAEAPAPRQVALVPARLPHIRPRLIVSRGDSVRLGSVLAEDKRDPRITCRAPGAGTISEIRFGPRRVMEAVVIDLDDTEVAEPLPGVSMADLHQLDRRALVLRVLGTGLWPLIRQRPFGHCLNPDSLPDAIVVALDNRQPFHPSPAVYLAGRVEMFRFGLALLRRLFDAVHVAAHADNLTGLDGIAGDVTHAVAGPYPAGDPGALIHWMSRSPADHRRAHISGQDLLLLASALTAGRYPTERIVAVAGPGADRPGHVRTRIGAPLAAMVTPADPGAWRWIMGGVFSGAAMPSDAFLGQLETAVTLVPKGADEEFLGFIRPGVNKPSFSRAFLSAVGRGPYPMDCNVHGELRACVACSFCNRVCPVDLLPQRTFKAVLAGETEDALALGLLDCIECGLCTFVCPSKIDIAGILREAIRAYAKEQEPR